MFLKAPEGCGSVSFAGQEYPVQDGLVEVPDEAQVLLEPGYGFVQIPPEPKTENQKPKTGK